MKNFKFAQIFGFDDAASWGFILENNALTPALISSDGKYAINLFKAKIVTQLSFEEQTRIFLKAKMHKTRNGFSLELLEPIEGYENGFMFNVDENDLLHIYKQKHFSIAKEHDVLF